MIGDGDSGADARRADTGAFSLRRWSQRKHAAARAATTSPAAGRDAAADGVAAPVGSGSVTAGAASSQPAASGAPVSDLPAIETLTADSDFAPFMRPGVDADLRREALKKLLRDPRFNVMDGLDVYIDDYTKTKPIEPSLARELVARLHPRLADAPAPGIEPAAVAAAQPAAHAPPPGGAAAGELQVSSGTNAGDATACADPGVPDPGVLGVPTDAPGDANADPEPT